LQASKALAIVDRIRIDYTALWDAIKRDPSNPEAKDAELARQAEAERRRTQPTTRIRYRNTDESGGVAVEPEDEG